MPSVRLRARFVVPLLALLVTGAVVVSLTLSPDEGAPFHAIFDGTSLDGWHVTAQTKHSAASGNTSGGRWEVRDGAIEGSQDTPGNGGLLLTDKAYGDVEVVFEVNHDFGPDSGLFLRSTDGGHAFQAMIDYYPGGTLMGIYGERIAGGIHERNFSFGDTPAEIVRTPHVHVLPILPESWPFFWRHGQWNELRARIVGQPPTLTTWINGVRVMTWTDTRPRLPDTGFLGFQVHGGGDTTGQRIRIRNIRVRER